MDSPEIDGKVYFESKTPVDIGEYTDVKITSYDEYDLAGKVE